MELLNLFFVTESILAILASLLIIVALGVLILTYREIKEITKRVEELANEGKETAKEARYYVDKIGRSLFEYTILKMTNRLTRKKK